MINLSKIKEYSDKTFVLCLNINRDYLLCTCAMCVKASALSVYYPTQLNHREIMRMEKELSDSTETSMRTQNLSQRLFFLCYWQLECLFFFLIIWKTHCVSVAENNFFHSSHKTTQNYSEEEKT